MTKQINRTIRSLKIALIELDYIKIEDYLINDELNNLRYAINQLNEARFQIKTLIDNFEYEYKKTHTTGSYRRD